jgi:hypothetical protein
VLRALLDRAQTAKARQKDSAGAHGASHAQTMTMVKMNLSSEFRLESDHGGQGPLSLSLGRFKSNHGLLYYVTRP